MTTARITVTLPPEVVDEIDRREGNRSRFVLHAVEAELERRKREELMLSLANPHPEAEEIAEEGFDDWGAGLPSEDHDGLVDPSGGSPVSWQPGRGWREE